MYIEHLKNILSEFQTQAVFHHVAKSSFFSLNKKTYVPISSLKFNVAQTSSVIQIFFSFIRGGSPSLENAPFFIQFQVS